MTNDIAIRPPAALGFLAAATSTFEGIEKLAALMAKMGTMPDHLKDKPADCFRIVVQAAKWGMDPFAVAECTSLVHGRLCWEGKLVAAALTAMNAIDGRLVYETTGSGQDAAITVTGKPRGGELCSIRGTVKDWRTVTKGRDGGIIPNAWDKDPMSMLVYRGTRQWARLYAPEALLGVVTPDEREEIREVEGVVVSSVPEAKPAKEREAPMTPADYAAQGSTTAAATPAKQEALIPTVADLNEAARALHKEFGSAGGAAIKEIVAALAVTAISLTPPEKVAEGLRLVGEHRTKLAAAVAKAVANPPKTGA
ncbi:MAG TPA: recombinase RecT [Planctomycetota bacterium]|nr:recombinase RecT [Planctomycetota bacterium]